MFYHIRIDYYNNKLKGIQTLYESDHKDIDTIISNVVIKYLSNEKLLFDGAIIASENIESIHIYSTDNSIDTIIDRERKQDDVCYDESDILGERVFSKDITRKVMY